MVVTYVKVDLTDIKYRKRGSG